ncbi:MAG: tautomerase family protein [Rhodospirillaceae bacterium]|nr:tautomerase family protein [Rhodospirillaceae bacterium]
MPYIRVELLKGRSPEQKKELAKALTETYARVFETRVDGIHVTFDEREHHDWALGGVPFTERLKNRKKESG